MNDALTPKAVVAALDAHIIGQKDAKRAVAVALRNRWRRQRLPDELRDEVTPKNILMIGPTGCGKTEISRRLAKLADAPFVKVEATKFTEVGYVGRDVEQIARDLVEEAVRLEKERRRVAVKDKAEEAAMARLAGMPPATVARAKAVLAKLEAGRTKTGGLAAGLDDLPLFAAAAAAVPDEKRDPLREAVEGLEVDALSPREALEVLYRLKGIVREG